MEATKNIYVVIIHKTTPIIYLYINTTTTHDRTFYILEQKKHEQDLLQFIRQLH